MFDVVTATSHEPVATGDVLIFPYPAGTVAADFTADGHKASSRGLMDSLSLDDGDFTLSFGASFVTMTYFGATSIPSGTVVRLELHRWPSTFSSTLPGWVGYTLDTKARLEVANVPPFVDSLALHGYTAAADGSGALYKRVPSEPSHADKIQIADGTWAERVAVRDLTPFAARSSLFVSETSDPDNYAKDIIRAEHAGAHIGQRWASQHMEIRPTGSGENGPSSADVGKTLSIIKKDWGTTNVNGEIDGLYIFLRQGGPDGAPGTPFEDRSDAAGILINAANRGTSGAVEAFEAVVSNIDRAGAIAKQVKVQSAVISTNIAVPTSYGYITVATVGAVDHAYYAGETSPGTFVNLFYAPDRIAIKRDGRIQLWESKSTGGGTRLTIRNIAGSFSLLNAAESAEVFKVDHSTGKVSTAGAYSGTSYEASGLKVVGSRKTGWSGATGTASRSTFDTATVTLEQLAQRFKALQDDLTTHGLIGA